MRQALVGFGLALVPLNALAMTFNPAYRGALPIALLVLGAGCLLAATLMKKRVPRQKPRGLGSRRSRPRSKYRGDGSLRKAPKGPS